MASVVLLNRYTGFHINDYRVHFFFDFFTTATFVLIVGCLFKKLKTTWSIVVTFVMVGIVFFIKAFLTLDSDWKTQIILYQSKKDKSKTINYQMRADRFSFGYKERVVTIYSILPFMEWTSDADTLHLDKSKWEKLNLRINQMRLPKKDSIH